MTHKKINIVTLDVQSEELKTLIKNVVSGVERRWLVYPGSLYEEKPRSPEFEGYEDEDDIEERIERDYYEERSSSQDDDDDDDSERDEDEREFWRENYEDFLFPDGESERVYRFRHPESSDSVRNFVNTEPHILFVSDYIVDDKKIGVLIAFERVLGASHYEVFKKNLFNFSNESERILFLSEDDLLQESNNYRSFLQETIGLNIDLENAFVVLDTLVKQDRIYEYSVRAAKIPESEKGINYGFALQSNGLAKEINTKAFGVDLSDRDDVDFLFNLASLIFGSRDLAWVLALMNGSQGYFNFSFEDGRFDDRRERDRQLIDTSERDGLLVPDDVKYIFSIFNDSSALFGVENTFEHLLRSLGGLTDEFIEKVMSALGDSGDRFYYDVLKRTMLEEIPSLNLAFEIAESGSELGLSELSSFSIVVPTATGSEPLTSLDGLSRVIGYINTFFTMIYNTQNSREDLLQIQEKIKEEQQQKDAIEQALEDSQDEYQDRLDSDEFETGSYEITEIGTQGEIAQVATPPNPVFDFLTKIIRQATPAEGQAVTETAKAPLSAPSVPPPKIGTPTGVNKVLTLDPRKVGVKVV